MKKYPIKALILSALIYLAVAIFLSTIPLFDILGYEFSLSIAVLAYLVSGMFLIFTITNKNKSDNDVCHLFIFSISLVVVPLLFMTVKGFFITNCNFLKGLSFFLLIPFISAIFGSSIGLFVSRVLDKKIYRIFTFLFISLLILLKAPYDFIYGPSVNSFNHIFGFFAGPIYDEIVEIGKPLIFYRAYTLTLSIFFITLALTVKRIKGTELISKALSAIFIISFLTALFFIFDGENLGFNNTHNFIQKKLGGKFETGNFIFYFPKSLDGKVHTIADEFEYNFAVLKTDLKISPYGKISVYIYKDEETQKDLMGSRGIFISKPSTKEIHLTYAFPLYLPIKHELTHILAGEFGFPIIKISPRIVLLEGLAEAMVGYHENITLDEYCSALFKLGFDLDINSIMSPLGFWSKQGAIAYFKGGSFTKFLIDNYGIDKFKEVYRGRSFKEVYGKFSKNITDDWIKKIKEIQISDEQLKKAEILFKPKGIFEKSCAHEVAFLLNRGNELFKSGTKEDALKIFDNACLLSNKEPNVVKKFAMKLFDSSNCERASNMASQLLEHSDNPAYVLNEAHRIIGDCKILNGSTVEALKEFSLITGHNDSNPEDLDNRLKISTLENKSDLTLIKNYILEKDPLKKIDILKELSLKTKKNDLANLMISKIYFTLTDFQNAKTYLNKITNKIKEGSIDIYRLRLLAISYFYTSDLNSSEKIFEKIKIGYPSPANQIFVSDWQEKIKYYRSAQSLLK